MIILVSWPQNPILIMKALTSGFGLEGLWRLKQLSGSFRKLGVPYLGVLVIRILRF